MSVEKDLLISVLKLTKNQAVKQESIKSDAKLPSSVVCFLLGKLQTENLLYLKDGLVEVTAESRLKIAVKAVQLGADVERVSDFLQWQEFETMTAVALECNGYVTAKNVRFTHETKRCEIDVVGCKRPLVVCVDCKQWHHGMGQSALKRMVESQTARVAAFAGFLPNKKRDFSCVKWEKATFIPIILSLIPISTKFFNQVPVVPVLQLQDFLNQLPLNLEMVKCFPRKFEHL